MIWWLQSISITLLGKLESKAGNMCQVHVDSHNSHSGSGCESKWYNSLCIMWDHVKWKQNCFVGNLWWINCQNRLKATVRWCLLSIYARYTMALTCSEVVSLNKVVYLSYYVKVAALLCLSTHTTVLHSSWCCHICWPCSCSSVGVMSRVSEICHSSNWWGVRVRRAGIQETLRNLIGIMNMGDISNHFFAFECSLKNDAS